MEVRVITKENEQDIRIPNEPFCLFGRMIPSFDGANWNYQEELWKKEEYKRDCFPDENYDFDEMAKEYIFLGAYEDGTCVGLAVLKHAMFAYLYLDDLKVKKDFRGKGVGKKLIDGCLKVAKEHGYCGVYTIGQDNNLGACRFYIKNHFEIGGVNTHIYKGTNQEGKSNIYFYRNC